MVAVPLHPLLVEARAANRRYRAAEDAVTEVLRSSRLTTARCLVLEALDRSAVGLSISQLSRFLGVHRTSVNSAVDKLLAAGMIEKLDNPHDGRASLVRLLPSGSVALSEARGLLSRVGAPND